MALRLRAERATLVLWYSFAKESIRGIRAWRIRNHRTESESQRKVDTAYAQAESAQFVRPRRIVLDIHSSSRIHWGVAICNVVPLRLRAAFSFVCFSLHCLFCSLHPSYIFLSWSEYSLLHALHTLYRVQKRMPWHVVVGGNQRSLVIKTMQALNQQQDERSETTRQSLARCHKPKLFIRIEAMLLSPSASSAPATPSDGTIKIMGNSSS